MNHSSARRRLRGLDLAVAMGAITAVAIGGWLVTGESVPLVEAGNAINSTTTITPSTIVLTPIAASPPAVSPGSADTTASLTGRPVGAAGSRRALVVKIDDAPAVAKFSGLGHADLIYEVIVEGGLTRYLAVFQSEDASVVGPVRSLRTTDFDLVANLGHPVVAFSGANDLVLQGARSAPLIPFSPDSADGVAVFHREPGLRAPHNLFLSTAGVRSKFIDAGTVTPAFEHEAANGVQRRRHASRRRRDPFQSGHRLRLRLEHHTEPVAAVRAGSAAGR